MRHLSTLALAGCLLGVPVESALAQTAAPGGPSTDPVARLFRFTTSSVTTTGPGPQVMVRVDQAGATTATARLALTPITAAGKVKRNARRVSVPLGQIAVNETVSPMWPATRTLARGRYRVKLNATTDTGAKLVRPLGAPGVTQLKVVAGRAVAASVSTLTGGAVSGVAATMVALAQAEVGVVESPKGSNDSPRIALYRASVPGGPVGAWCAYFTSWLARTAGYPLGERGQGYGRVDDLYAWAVRNGKALPAAGVPVLPGDFMVWDEHIGIVEAVAVDGTITTIDGNYSDAVTRRVLPASRLGGVVGYVRL